MNDTVYLIIPGYEGSDENHWQSYFEKRLPNCYRVDQKSWDNPECNDWITNIQHHVMKWGAEKVILIGHSLGGIAIAHWTKQYEMKIKGAFIVAPPDIENPSRDLPLNSFVPIPQDKLPFPSILIGSNNDHWATAVRIQEFAANWGSELLFIGNAGHINSDSGHGNWDEGLVLLNNFKKKIHTSVE